MDKSFGFVWSIVLAGKKPTRVAVKVGEEYQADVPVYAPGKVDEEYPEKAMLVWSPSNIDESECKSW